MNRRRPSLKSSARRGFSLMELMVVVAIVSLMSVISIPSLGSIMVGRSLSQAIDLTQSAVLSARQRAMGHGNMVVLLITPPQGASRSQTESMMLLEGCYSPSGTLSWNAAGPWIHFPSTVQISPYTGNGGSAFYQASGTSDAQIPTLPTQVQGRDISQCFYIVFFPDGSVSAPSAAGSPAFGLQRTTKGGTSPDYVVLIQEDSGRAKVITL